MSDENHEELSAEIIAAIEDYSAHWPVPYALAPNLDLAARALAALTSEREELNNAQNTLMLVRSWAVEATFTGEESGYSVLEILQRTTNDESLPVSNEPYRTRGGRIPTQEERDEVREILAKNKRDERNSRSVEIDLEGLTHALFERSHEPSFEDNARGLQEAQKFAQSLIDTYVELHHSTDEEYDELSQRAENGELTVKPETVLRGEEASEAARRVLAEATESSAEETLNHLHKLDGTTKSAVKLLTNATDEEIAALGGIDHVSDLASDEREEQAQREAEAYAPDNEEAQDDFLTGWRTADRMSKSLDTRQNNEDCSYLKDATPVGYYITPRSGKSFFVENEPEIHASDFPSDLFEVTELYSRPSVVTNAMVESGARALNPEAWLLRDQRNDEFRDSIVNHTLVTARAIIEAALNVDNS